MSKAVIQCGTCGKPVEDGEDYVGHVAGRMVNGKPVDKATLGRLHRACHNKTFISPNAMSDELARQARQPIR